MLQPLRSVAHVFWVRVFLGWCDSQSTPLVSQFSSHRQVIEIGCSAERTVFCVTGKNHSKRDWLVQICATRSASCRLFSYPSLFTRLIRAIWTGFAFVVWFAAETETEHAYFCSTIDLPPISVLLKTAAPHGAGRRSHRLISL